MGLARVWPWVKFMRGAQVVDTGALSFVFVSDHFSVSITLVCGVWFIYMTLGSSK